MQKHAACALVCRSGEERPRRAHVTARFTIWEKITLALAGRWAGHRSGYFPHPHCQGLESRPTPASGPLWPIPLQRQGSAFSDGALIRSPPAQNSAMAAHSPEPVKIYCVCQDNLCVSRAALTAPFPGHFSFRVLTPVQCTLSHLRSRVLLSPRPVVICSVSARGTLTNPGCQAQSDLLCSESILRPAPPSSGLHLSYFAGIYFILDPFTAVGVSALSRLQVA